MEIIKKLIPPNIECESKQIIDIIKNVCKDKING